MMCKTFVLYLGLIELGDRVGVEQVKSEGASCCEDVQLHSLPLLLLCLLLLSAAVPVGSFIGKVS